MSLKMLDALKQAMSKSGLTEAFIAEPSRSDGIEPLSCTSCQPGCEPGCPNGCPNSSGSCVLL